MLIVCRGRTPNDGRSTENFGTRADEPVWLVGCTHIAKEEHESGRSQLKAFASRDIGEPKIGDISTYPPGAKL